MSETKHTIIETKVEEGGTFLVRYSDGSEYRHSSYEEAKRCHRGVPYLSDTVFTGVRIKDGEAAQIHVERLRKAREKRARQREHPNRSPEITHERHPRSD